MRKFFVAAAVLAAFGVSSLALAGEAAWPAQAVELVIPANPGGDTDINARVFAKYLEKELGQPVVIVNMAGAAGTVALNNVKSARPNGYRAVFYHSGALIAQIMGLMDYSVTDGFELAAMPVIDKSNCFASNAKAPFNNMKELVELAKKTPEQVSFGTEMGSFTHLHILALEEVSGAKFNIVDAGTAAEKTTALLGGRLDVIGTQYGLMASYIKNGDFKCVGILSDKRLEGAADVRTFKDDGYDIVFDKFFYIGFPKGTDKAILDKFNAASKKVAENPEYIADCKKNFVDSAYKSQADIVTYIDEQFVLYKKYEKALTGGE